jgi:hypothetical protein
VYVAADWPEERVEALGAMKLSNANELQRLIDAATSVLVLDDADRVKVV